MFAELRELFTAKQFVGIECDICNRKMPYISAITVFCPRYVL